MKNYIFAIGLGMATLFSQTSCEKCNDCSCDSTLPECAVDETPETLSCDAFTTAMTLTNNPDKPVDYYIDCVMEANAAITIEAGVVIEFADDAGIQVNETGTLSINGTASEKVILRGKNQVTGAWKGLLYDSPNTQNQITHTEIHHAGGSTFNSNGDQAAIIIWSDTKLDMDNILIQNSGMYGISAIYTNSAWTLANSEITQNNDAPIVLLPSYMGNLDVTTTYTNNTNDYIEVEINTDDIRSNTTWRQLNVPYRVVSNTSFFDFLTIAEGTVTVTEPITIEFSAGTGLYIDDDGTLDLNATGNGATFTGVDKTAGSWKCVYFQFTQGNNRLKNLTIEHAGNTYDGDNTAIGMWGDARLTLDNIRFNDIMGCAITDNNNSAASPNPNFMDANNHTYTNVSGNNMCY